MDLTEKQFVGSKLISDVDAGRIGSFMETWFGEQPVRPAQLVDAARPESSPIHQDFEWDDTTAAREYRLVQARRILRSIHVVFRESDQPTRAYHSVVVKTRDDNEERAYIPAAVVWKDPDISAQVIAEALSELRGWAARFRRYEELARITEAVDQMLIEFAT